MSTQPTADDIVDPRRQRRIDIMQALFAYSFHPDQPPQDPQYAELLPEIIAEIPEIDALLTSAAPERPLAEINKVDLAILRLIMFESKHKKTPKKVLLNEAIELGKAFGTESSHRFINAVLGKLLITEITET